MGGKAVPRLRRSFIFFSLFPALRPGLRTVGPTGLTRGKRGHIASFRRNRGVTWQFSTPVIARETLCHKAFRVSRQKLAKLAGRNFRLRKRHKNETTDEHRAVCISVHLWFHSFSCGWLHLCYSSVISHADAAPPGGPCGY